VASPSQQSDQPQDPQLLFSLKTRIGIFHRGSPPRENRASHLLPQMTVRRPTADCPSPLRALTAHPRRMLQAMAPRDRRLPVFLPIGTANRSLIQICQQGHLGRFPRACLKVALALLSLTDETIGTIAITETLEMDATAEAVNLSAKTVAVSLVILNGGAKTCRQLEIPVV